MLSLLPKSPRTIALLTLTCAAVGCGHIGIDLDSDGSVSVDDGSGGVPTNTGGRDAAVTQNGGTGGGSEAASGGSAAIGGSPTASGGNGDGGSSAGGSGWNGDGGRDGDGGWNGGGRGGDGGWNGGGGRGGDGGWNGDGDGGGSVGGGSGGGGSGGEPPVSCEGGTDTNFNLVGWAKEAGGTTGGKGGTIVRVQNGAQLLAALNQKNSSVPLTILVGGTITGANSGVEKIDIRGVRDVSIIGEGQGAQFNGIGLRLIETGNIVLRNLRIHHVAQGEGDAVGISGPVDHVWIDHCEFYSEFQGVEKEVYDGLVDAKNDVAYLTYSWNYFHDSWWTALVGATETDTYDRKLTMHHNWVSNCNTGAPSMRGGNGHVFSNYFEDIAQIGINTRLGACLRIENNVFANVNNPWASAFSTAVGAAEPLCNFVDEFSAFDFSDADVSEAPSCSADVPYDYADSLTQTDFVADLVRANAGVGQLDDPLDY